MRLAQRFQHHLKTPINDGYFIHLVLLRQSIQRKHFFVDKGHHFRHFLPGKKFIGPFDGLLPQLIEQFRILVELGLKALLVPRVVGGDQIARFTVPHAIFNAPTLAPITGVPQAIASTGVMPKGSYQGVLTKTSAAL